VRGSDIVAHSKFIPTQLFRVGTKKLYRRQKKLRKVLKSSEKFRKNQNKQLGGAAAETLIHLKIIK